jgi:copper chaperone
MLTFHIPDMHCDGCIRSLTKALQSVDQSATLQADLNACTVTANTTANRDAVAAAFEDAGFTVETKG